MKPSVAAFAAAAVVCAPAAATATEQSASTRIETRAGMWTRVDAPPYPAGAHTKFAVVSRRGVWPNYTEDVGAASACRYRSVDATGGVVVVAEVHACLTRPWVRVFTSRAASLKFEWFWWPRGQEPPSVTIDVPDLCLSGGAAVSRGRAAA